MTDTLSLPAGTWHLIYTSEAALVGSRSGIIGGVLGTLDEDFISHLSPEAVALMRDIFDNVDSHITPAECDFSTVIYRGEPLSFIGAINMGCNHNGWTDGTFIVSDAFLKLITDAGLADGLVDEQMPFPLEFSKPVTLIAVNDYEEDTEEVEYACFPFTVDGNPFYFDANGNVTY